MIKDVAAQHVATSPVPEEQKVQLALAEPKISLLHHIAATQAMETGFTVLLLDGSSYGANRGDFVFKDGLSIVHDGRRMYFPLTAVKAIVIKKPGEK
jgi:hypothetical protein